jgi:hypothetical protein
MFDQTLGFGSFPASGVCGPRVAVEALHIHDPMVGTEIALD